MQLRAIPCLIWNRRTLPLSVIVYNSEDCSRIINDAVRCWGLNRISEQRNIMAYDWSSYMGELVLKGKSKNQFKQQTESYPLLWLGETIHTRGHAWVDDDKDCVSGCHGKIHSLPLRRVV